MATEQEPVRTDSKYEAGAKGDAQFAIDHKAWVAKQVTPETVSTVKANANTIERNARFISASDLVVRERSDPADKTKTLTNEFYVLTFEDQKGKAFTMSVNRYFWEGKSRSGLKSQLNIGKPYQLDIEVRKAGVTTYEVNGKTMTHTSSGETITGAKPITEKAFGAMPNQEKLNSMLDTIASRGAEFQNSTVAVLRMLEETPQTA